MADDKLGEGSSVDGHEMAFGITLPCLGPSSSASGSVTLD